MSEHTPYIVRPNRHIDSPDDVRPTMKRTSRILTTAFEAANIDPMNEDIVVERSDVAWTVLLTVDQLAALIEIGAKMSIDVKAEDVPVGTVMIDMYETLKPNI